MKILNKVRLGVVVIFIFHAVFVLFILYDSDVCFYDDRYSTVSLVSLVDDRKLIRKLENNFRGNLSNINGGRDSFFSTMYRMLNQINIQERMLNIVSVDTVKMKIFQLKNFLINKLMHQSSDLLNFNIVENTTTVLNLYETREEVCWVIQLGAFKNSKKVFEIVNKLQEHNYSVYISPQFPQQGDIIRIFVYPDFSKENLEYILYDLYFLSGLSGKIILLNQDLRGE